MTPPIRVYTGKNVRVIVDEEARIVKLEHVLASQIQIVLRRDDMREAFELLKEIFEAEK